MKTEFKKGDRVRLINIGYSPNECKNWINVANLYCRNRMEPELKIGSELTVKSISADNGVFWLSFEENAYNQLAERFELI